MNSKYKLWIFCLICLIASSPLAAQNPLPCGNGIINTVADQNALKFQLRNINAKPSEVTYLIRVYFHIVTNDDGSNAAITTAQLKTEFETLQQTYASANICFLNAGTDSVKNTFLNIFFSANNDPEGTLFNAYLVPNCMNVFYTTKIKGDNTACNPSCGIGGVALGGIPGTFCLVAKNNIGSGNTISHEVGHCLGLFHTFETAYGFEKIDGSNSLYAGDKVTDTRADPYAYVGKSCFVFGKNQCTFIGICPDSTGEIKYTPPYSNLMAYWWNGMAYWWNGVDSVGLSVTCYKDLTTTSGQFARVNSFLGSFLPLIGCSSPSDVTQSGINVSSGYYMNSAINTFTTSGSVFFSGSAKATIGGGKVYLKQGFHASPTTGIVRIESKPCN